MEYVFGSWYVFSTNKVGVRPFGYSCMVSVGKLTRWHQSVSLSPRSHSFSPHILQTVTLHDCATVEITSGLHMHITRYLCGLGLLCVVCLYELHHGSPGCYFTGATLELHCVMALLWLCCGHCYSCCISQERGCVMAAVPARRE